MSDYGMMVFNQYGQTRLSITDRSFRLVGVFGVGQNVESCQYFQGLSTKGAVAFASTYNQLITNLCNPHRVYVSGDYVCYDRAGLTHYPTGPSIIWVYATT